MHVMALDPRDSDSEKPVLCSSLSSPSRMHVCSNRKIIAEWRRMESSQEASIEIRDQGILITDHADRHNGEKKEENVARFLRPFA